MPAPRRGNIAVVLQRHNCVLFAGGHDGKSDTKTTCLLDLCDIKWRRGPDLVEARSGATAVMLADDSVLFVGGRTGGRRIASTEVLRSETTRMRFEPGPTLAQGRTGAVVVPVTHAAGVLTAPRPHRGDDDEAALLYNLRERAARTGGVNPATQCAAAAACLAQRLSRRLGRRRKQPCPEAGRARGL
ncbi:hypothetical protein M885DRAFT_570091 [Pelagophyceae sp. CCMP2097]|nr:hypothetical protein M885DRAFT_570091 [Pelagophyceae sp. CCMP2097]